MSYDIYGNNLQAGHCEVHPHVHEEYPCSSCVLEMQRYDAQSWYDQSAETEHYLVQATEEIHRLTAELDRKDKVIEAVRHYKKHGDSIRADLMFDALEAHDKAGE